MTAALPDHWTLLPLRTPTLPPATTTNAAIIGRDRLLVVDPGSPHPDEQARLLAILTERHALGHHLAGIFLTHHHHDHLAGVEALRAQLAALGLAAPVLAHPLTFERAPSLPVPEADRLTVEHGHILNLGGHTLKILHTPGHTRGHLALLDTSSGVAYAGDMVASDSSIIIDPPDGDMAAYLHSLQRLRALSLQLLIPSHGAPIEAPDEHLAQVIDHRLAREALVLAALDHTPRIPAARVPAAYPEVPPALYPLAERSLLAHLIKLGDDKLASRHGAKWRLAPT